MNDPSPKKVYCSKLKKELPALQEPPFPGPLGERIFCSISAQAWQSWTAQQTILINEYRLNVSEPASRSFLKKELVRFLFDEELK